MFARHGQSGRLDVFHMLFQIEKPEQNKVFESIGTVLVLRALSVSTSLQDCKH